MTSFLSRLFRNSSTRSRRRSRQSCLEALESRLVLSAVSVAATAFGNELRIDGTNAQNNTFTVDYNSGTDTYTIADTSNLLTAGVGATQVDPNTVTVPGASVSDRVLVRMFNGTNTVVFNGGGGAGWGNEGLQVNDVAAAAETVTIGAGGVSVLAGAGRGNVILLNDATILNGSINTVAGNYAITFGNSIGDTVDVMGTSVVDAGTNQVTVNGLISSANTSDLSVNGSNTLFKNTVSGLGNFVATASNLVQLDGAGGVGAVSSDIRGDVQLRILGTLSGGSSRLNSKDLRLASATVNNIVVEVGNLTVTGTLTPAVFAGSTATLRSRVAGNDITVFNSPVSLTNEDSLTIGTTRLAKFAGYEELIIGGAQGGVQTGKITIVDNPSINRITLAQNTTLIATTIDSDEGVNIGAFGLHIITKTYTASNASSFAGSGGMLLLEALDSLGGDDTITVNGIVLAKAGTVSLTVQADVSATVNATVGNFSDVDVTAPLASFTDPTAVTSNGHFDYGAPGGTLSVNGGIFANGDINVDGSLNLLGNTLLQARAGGFVLVDGAVTGNGFDLNIRGISAGTPASSVTIVGPVSGLSRFAVDHSGAVSLMSSVTADAGAGSDISVRTNGNLVIGGDLVASDRVDLTFLTADLNLGNRLINSIADSGVSVIGNLLGGGTLTIDILGGTFSRIGNDGGVTVTLV